MLLFDDYKKILYEKINKIYKINENDIEINNNYGDFTLKIFKLKDKPDIIYKNIKDKLNDKFIDKIELNGNYVNFFIKPSSMIKTVNDSIHTFGKYPNTFQDTSRVLIEHTSSNPTGPIHVGRIRNSIIGDSVFRIINRYGYRSCTQYFVNDSGKQVIALYLGHIMYHKDEELTVENLLDGYQKIYNEREKNSGINKEIEALAEKYERGDKELINNIQNTASVVLESIKKSLKKLDIVISTYVWESNFILYGDVYNVLNELSDYLQSEGTAKYIEIGDKKIFLTRDNGTSLYPARDIAYHLFKAENFDWLIDVLGEDHKDHAKNLDYILSNYLDFNARVSYLFYGFVSLESGKMSTRKGRIVTLDDLYDKTVEESIKIIKEKRPEYDGKKIEEISNGIASSSIRYNIVKVNANKPLTFKWSEALNFEGDSAPYIMYSYARSCSILSKSGDYDEISNDYNEHEKKLIKAMYTYPYYLKNSVDYLRPDIIANYLLNLVKSFNEFYLNCTIIGDPEMKKRITLLKLYKKILEDASNLIGIKLLNSI